MPQPLAPQHRSQITGGQRVLAALGLKERARSPDHTAGALVPGRGKYPGAGHWLSCATQNSLTFLCFHCKMEKCGINLPCSMLLTSLRL